MKPAWMIDVKRKSNKTPAIVFDGKNNLEIIKFLNLINDVSSARNGGRYIKVVLTNEEEFTLTKGDVVVFDKYEGPLAYDEETFKKLYSTVK